MKTTIISLITLVFLTLNIASADDFSEAIVKAKKDLKTAMDKFDKNDLTKVRGKFERILQLKKNEWLVNYYLAFVDLQLSYVAMQDKKNDDMKKYTESSLKLLDKVTDVKEDFAEAYILKMAANSNRWSYEMDKMNDIIAKGAEAEETAKKLDPDNPRFYNVKGTITFYTPESFGGGADAALPLFEKANTLFQTRKEKDETLPDWGQEATLGMLAMVMIQKDKLDDAKKYIDKALELNPDSGFIKNYVMKQYDEAKKK
jgi:tetratricopeptide (TPR) repeat protein